MNNSHDGELLQNDSSDIPIAITGQPNEKPGSRKHSCNEEAQQQQMPENEVLINGISSDVNQPDQQLLNVTPEMLYKLSKKIAQLTKV